MLYGEQNTFRRTPGLVTWLFWVVLTAFGGIVGTLLTTAYNCAQIKLTVPRDGCSLWEMPFNISAGDSHDQEQDSEQDTRLSR